MKDNHHPPSQENKYYEAVIHNSPAAIVVIDHDSHITEWNPLRKNCSATPAMKPSATISMI